MCGQRFLCVQLCLTLICKKTSGTQGSDCSMTDQLLCVTSHIIRQLICLPKKCLVKRNKQVCVLLFPLLFSHFLEFESESLYLYL